MLFKRVVIFFAFLNFIFFPKPTFAANPLDIVISEVAWSGTKGSSSDEWIELYNNTDNDIELAGWTLKATDGTPDITLSGVISAKGYFLLERTDNNTTNVSEDIIYKGALGNSGESLELKDGSGVLIDTANGDGGSWPFGTDGSGTPPYSSMERLGLSTKDADDNWVTNDGVTINGLDTEGNPINGTPRSQSSQGFVPTPTSNPTPTSVPTPTKIPTATKTPVPTKAETSDFLLKNTPTPVISKKQIAPSTVLGEKTERKNKNNHRIVLDSNEEESKEDTNTGAKFLSKTFLTIGGIFLISSGIMFARSYIKNRRKNDI